MTKHLLKVKTKDYDWHGHVESRLLCPICGDEYVRIDGNSRTIPGYDNYHASLFCRGDVTEIPMCCENGGHSFLVCLGFHKGNTLLFALPASEL